MFTATRRTVPASGLPAGDLYRGVGQDRSSMATSKPSLRPLEERQGRTTLRPGHGLAGEPQRDRRRLLRSTMAGTARRRVIIEARRSRRSLTRRATARVRISSSKASARSRPRSLARYNPCRLRLASRQRPDGSPWYRRCPRLRCTQSPPPYRERFSDRLDDPLAQRHRLLFVLEPFARTTNSSPPSGPPCPTAHMVGEPGGHLQQDGVARLCRASRSPL